jgi:hypothetical protein
MRFGGSTGHTAFIRAPPLGLKSPCALAAQHPEFAGAHPELALEGAFLAGVVPMRSMQRRWSVRTESAARRASSSTSTSRRWARAQAMAGPRGSDVAIWPTSASLNCD